MSGRPEEGALHPVSLRFLDSSLERSFQYEEGKAGLAGFRITSIATAVLWAIAAVILPLGTGIDSDQARTVGLLMAAAGSIVLLLSRWTATMNHQHFLAALLTSANGVVILLLAATAGFVEGYAVGAILLLYLFALAARTRFVFAALRTVVIGIGFGVVAVSYQPNGSLLLDAFILIAASAGSLLGLRLIEINRRVTWYQRQVILQQGEVIEAEKAETERLLLNILPQAVSKRLRAGENPIADDFAEVTVLFADIVGFTSMASRMRASDVIKMLSHLYTRFDDLALQFGVEKIKTIGDSYMAVGGIPEPHQDHARRAVDLAVSMLATAAADGPFPNLPMRIGVHSGPVAGGVIGSRKFAYDVWGDTVNIAARLEKAGLPGRVHVSQRTRDLTCDAYAYESLGPVELRGVGVVTSYLLVAPATPRNSTAVTHEDIDAAGGGV